MACPALACITIAGGSIYQNLYCISGNIPAGQMFVGKAPVGIVSSCTYGFLAESLIVTTSPSFSINGNFASPGLQCAYGTQIPFTIYGFFEDIN